MTYSNGSNLDAGIFAEYETGARADGGDFNDPGKTALEKMSDFIATYPHYDHLSEFMVDYTDQVSDCAGLFPDGLVEISRSRDILPRELGGKTRVTSQYNFAIYTVFPKSRHDDEGAAYNAEWVMDFQEWVQERSAAGLAPMFGDVASDESMSAQNGQLYAADDEGTGMYVIQLSATFTKEY